MTVGIGLSSTRAGPDVRTQRSGLSVGQAHNGIVSTKHRSTAQVRRSGDTCSRLQLLLAVFSLLLAACSSSSGAEVGTTLCSDKEDNDGDGLINCEDPDCFALEACRPNARMTSGSPTPKKPDAGFVTPAGGTDAGSVGIPPAGAVDGGPDPKPTFVDAGAFACSPCRPTEACVEGQCQVVAVDQAAHYLLHILSAVAPDQDISTRCYDSLPDCKGNISISPYAVCNCPTDPFVRVILSRGTTTMLIGMTEAVTDDATPTYPRNDIDLSLEPGDVLIFEVWDAEPPPKNEEMLYACMPDLSALRAGPISCSALGGPLGAQLLGVKAELEAL